MDSFVPTLTILAALKTRMEALALPDGGPAAFETVQYYARPNLAQALEDLLLFEDRVCLIVSDGDDYEHKQAGRILATECVRRVVLLFADRDFGDRQAAQTGDVDTTGVIELDRLVVADILGSSLGLDRVRVRCDTSEPFLISSKDKEKLRGREAWHLDLSIEAGHVRTAINR